MKTVARRFANVEEFIADMKELLPMIECVRGVAAAGGHNKMVKESDRLQKMFEDDCHLLRRMYQRVAKPDGSAEFRYDASILDQAPELRGTFFEE